MRFGELGIQKLEEGIKNVDIDKRVEDIVTAYLTITGQQPSSVIREYDAVFLPSKLKNCVIEIYNPKKASQKDYVGASIVLKTEIRMKSFNRFYFDWEKTPVACARLIVWLEDITIDITKKAKAIIRQIPEFAKIVSSSEYRPGYTIKLYRDQELTGHAHAEIHIEVDEREPVVRAGIWHYTKDSTWSPDVYDGDVDGLLEAARNWLVDGIRTIEPPPRNWLVDDDD